jgi:hypothetical protein
MGVPGQVVMDDAHKKVKPANMNARTTLILRNIPSSAAEADVQAFLSKGKLPAVVSLRADVGDNWFATFESEDAAKNALQAAKALKWEGKTVGCALKSENLLKGIVPGAPPSTGPGLPQVPGYYAHMQQYPSMPYGYGYPQQGDGQGGYRQGGRGQGGRRMPGGPEAAKDAMGSLGLDGGDAQRRGAKKGKGRMGREGGREGRDAASGDAADAAAAQQPPINLSEFPSLGAAGKKGSKGDNAKAAGGDGEKRGADGASAKVADAGSDQPHGPASSSDPSGSSGSASTSDGSSENGTEQAAAPMRKKLSYAQMAQLNASASANSNAGASASSQGGAAAKE